MVPFRSNLAGLTLALLCSVLTTRSEETPGAAPPLVTSWLNAQTNIQCWSADVTQIRALKTLTQPLTATGHVWFAAPNQFRWEIGKPAQTIAIRKSDEMLVIYPRFKRAERYSFAGQQSGPWKDTLALLEAGFPRNEADLNKQFRIKSLSTSNNVCELKLEPRSAGGKRMMPQISIAFSTTDYMLRATELQFADGSTMRNQFSNPQLNPPIDPALFTPQLGPDYKIVEPMKH
jgi:outer membrane lipoprotein-sorting protein